jgi:SM-20-related protein
VPVLLKGETIPSYYLLYENFLADDELAPLLNFAIASESKYVDGEVTGEVKNQYRKAKVLYRLPVFQEFFVNRVYAKLPQIFEFLGIAPFQPSEIEVQLTASNDGDFFKEHTDTGNDETRDRTITYVYYFWREPKNFDCGYLKMWDSKLDGSKGGFCEEIKPQNNTLIVFPSRCWHEVAPILGSGDFADSRFTVNGWIRR